MKRSTKSEKEIVAELMAEATSFAERCMVRSDRVPATLFIDGVNGQKYFAAENMSDEKARDEFADNSRLFCLANGAEAAVFVALARMNFTEKIGTAEATERASEIVTRRQVVILMGETRQEWEQRVFMVNRAENGKYAGLVEAAESNAQALKEYFGQFLTEDVPDERMRQEAERLLELKGVIWYSGPQRTHGATMARH